VQAPYQGATFSAELCGLYACIVYSSATGESGFQGIGTVQPSCLAQNPTMSSHSSSSDGSTRKFSQAFNHSHASATKRQATAQPACILVSTRQKGNSMLKSISNATWKFADIQPDFILGNSTGALYISLRYHLLHPDYLYSRMSQVKRSDFKVRIILCMVDIENSTQPLILLTSLASANDFTVILCWSPQECARYIETFKIYEYKSADSIQARLETDYLPRVQDTLTVIRSVNRTDVAVLSKEFGSLKNIMNASMEELVLCSGIGDAKVRRLHNAFHLPFK